MSTGRIGIDSLLTPPSPMPIAAFTPIKQATVSKQQLSPPDTPEDATFGTRSHLDQSASEHDPILFDDDVEPSQTTEPLFPGQPYEQRQSLIDSHRPRVQSRLFTMLATPKNEDYHLMLHAATHSQGHRNWLNYIQEHPRQYVEECRAQLIADREARRGGPNPPWGEVLQHRRQTAKAPTNRVVKRQPAKSNKPAATPRRAVKPTIKAISTGPETTRDRGVAPTREDKDFKSVRDICPPLVTLGSQHRSMKIDWKGNALSLAQDPHRALLHDQELKLAGALRLDCATYLTSKRRIFLRRLECLYMPKDFKKTDAQKACNIDVNKASKLWEAFESVGWFSTTYMDGHKPE